VKREAEPAFLREEGPLAGSGPAFFGLQGVPERDVSGALMSAETRILETLFFQPGVL